MILPDKVYQILKWFVVIVMPALATALFAIGQIWEWDNTSKVVGTLVALNTLLGACVGVSSIQYNASDEKYDGTIDPLTANSQTSDRALTLSTDEYDAANQKDVLLKVQVNKDSV